MTKIWLDAGHGGHDPGAIGSRSKEKDNALKLVLKLGDYLVKLGHTVRYSRKTDVFLSLSERARLANNWGADIFISVHNNAAVASATGFETFIYNGNVSSRTRKLQNDIHGVIAKEIGIRDRGKKRANFAVVRETKMSSILIEYGFITNRSDETILINEVDKLALLTANGIAKFYGQKQIKIGGLTVKQYNELKKLISAQDKKIKSLEKQLSKKQNKPSNSNRPDPSHANAWKKATDKGVIDGTRPHHSLTREQYTTTLNKLGLLD